MNFENLVYEFIERIQEMAPTSKKPSSTWEILFPDKNKKWHRIEVLESDYFFYVFKDEEPDTCLEILPGKHVKVSNPSKKFNIEEHEASWEALLQTLRQWLDQVEKDWISACLLLQEEYPYSRRFGIIQANILFAFLPKSKRLRKKLDKQKKSKTKELVLNQHSVGIIPDYKHSTRTNNFFPRKESLLRLMRFEELENLIGELLPFIEWKFLPFLKPLKAK